jgi:HAD superfamily hydrolase (TIGR01509 family)
MTQSSLAGAVLFDVDGTLVDTNYLHVFAWLGALEAVGHPVDAAAIHRGVGMGASQLLDRLLGDDAERLGRRATEEHAKRYRETFSLMRRFDGTTALLGDVARRASVVLATSAQPEELAALRRVLDADDVITAITSSDDVAAAKPEPDLVAVALKKAGVDAGRAVFVGDTVWDIEAANRAGVACVAVLSGGISRGELEAAGPAAIYDDVTALRQDLDRSPLTAVLKGAND